MYVPYQSGYQSRHSNALCLQRVGNKESKERWNVLIGILISTHVAPPEEVGHASRAPQLMNNPGLTAKI